MTRRQNYRPQRTPIFVGCEGRSEIGYVGWLRNMVRDQDLPFHIELYDLGKGAGEPVTRIAMAVDRIEQLEKSRMAFVRKFLFLDTDQLVGDTPRAELAQRRATENNIVVIWQHPTHEAFLLRHLPNCLTAQPPDKRRADVALAKKWAGYQKPLTADQIERRLDIDSARRASTRLPELQDLLRTIGLLD
jgi:hypothetical protein